MNDPRELGWPASAGRTRDDATRSEPRRPRRAGRRAERRRGLRAAGPARRLPRAINIGLNFGESDRAFGNTAISMEYGIMAVFPALILQPLIRQSSIFNEAVAIAIAMIVDPLQCRLDIG